MGQPLVGVTQWTGRRAWLYAASDGASLHALTREEPIPLRVVAEILATLAQSLEDVPDPLPALPGLTEVLARPSGELRWIGLAPLVRDSVPNRPAVVFALGNLGMAMVFGAPVDMHPQPSGHAAAVRRALTRAVSRPGPALPERLLDWLTAMLSFGPAERPTLLTTALVMREIAAGLARPGLREWASGAVDAARSTDLPPYLSDPAPIPVEPRPQQLRDITDETAMGPERQQTLRGDDGGLPERDDPTEISNQGAQPWSGPPERGTIPVKVGPPPEAVPRPTRLPEALFSKEGAVRPGGPERTDTLEASQLPFPLPPARAVTVFGVGLSLLAIALALYLFKKPRGSFGGLRPSGREPAIA